MELKEEWKNILHNNSEIYIYGAGKIGKRVLALISKEKCRHNVKSFLVTDSAQNPSEVEGIPVMQPEDVCNKGSLVLVCVTDVYKDSIVVTLESLGFSNIRLAYEYFLLFEEKEGLPETIEMDTIELLLCQYEKGQFCRYDIIVELMAVDHYYGRDAYGLDMCEKLKKRVGYEQIVFIDPQKREAFIQEHEDCDKTVDLILNVDSKLRLVDDPGKLALAMYSGIRRLKANILPEAKRIRLDKERMCQIYSPEELQLIEYRFLEEEAGWKQPIKGILWPSVAKYYDEIIEKIQEEYIVTNLHDYIYELSEFSNIVHKIYEIGNIEKWKVDIKLEHMLPFGPYRVRVFDITMGNPEFRIRKAGGILSDKGAKLKARIRDLYKDKVTNYFPDIIIHTADDFFQSRRISLLLQEES